MREIHGRLPSGEYVKGVEVFRQIYQRIGLGGLVAPTRLPGVRQLLDLAYRGFAFFRFKHAMHRLNKSATAVAEVCDNGKCRSASERPAETLR